MLEQYRQRYESYNAQCTRLAEQNRGGAYATGYRCLINFCKAYHEGRTRGFTFETSYALLAQDWGLSQSPKTIKRHLLRLSAEVSLLHTNRVGAGEQVALPLFNRLEEVRRKSYLNVKISLHPSFIVYCHEGVQQLHAKEYSLTTGFVCS